MAKLSREEKIKAYASRVYTTKTGRPTKFKKEYTQKLIEFFAVPFQKKQVTETTKEYFKDGEVKKEAEKFRYVPNELPTLFDFAVEIKVLYRTVYEWAEKGASVDLDELTKKMIEGKGISSKNLEEAKNLQMFSHAYKEAKELQQQFLMHNGLTGASPSPAYIFTAKNVTKMRDKSVYDVTHREVKPLLDNLRPLKTNGIRHNNSNGESTQSD